MSDIYEASKKGNLDKIKQLDCSKVNINSTDYSGKTALFYAAAYNHLEIVKYLLKHKADANVLNDCNKNGPLLQASANGYTHIVSCLLENGAAVNLCDDEKCSPLLYCAINGHMNTAIYLVEHGADVNQLDKTKTTPLCSAASRGYLEIVTYLVKSGADLDIADVYQQTAVSVASQEGHIETVEYLCRIGANLQIAINDGRTPFFLACQEKQLGIAQCLLEHGADIDACDSEGDSALHISAMQGYENIVKLLIRHNAKVKCNEQGKTPLSLANNSLAAAQSQDEEFSKVQDLKIIVSMLESYKPKLHTVKSENNDAKNLVEKGKSDSCIIPKDILDSPILKNLAEEKAKEAKEREDNAVAIIREKMKDENEYLKGLWAEINNVDKQITPPKKNPGQKDLSDKHLLKLAEEMEQDWKRIGGFLGVKHSQIRELVAENKDEPTYAAWSMLVSWRDSHEGGAEGGEEWGVEGKRRQLQAVLQELGRHDIMDML